MVIIMVILGPLEMVLIINNIQSNTCTIDNTVSLYAYNGGTITKENVTGLPTKGLYVYI